MTCDQAREYVNTTLPEERTPQQLDELQRHMADCADCSALIRELLHLEKELTELPSIRADDGILANVMDRLPPSSVQSAPAPGWAMRDLAWIASMLLGLTACVLVYVYSLDVARMLQQFWALHIAGSMSDPIVGFAKQPLSFILVSGIGAALFAAGLLRQDDEGAPDG